MTPDKLELVKLIHQWIVGVYKKQGASSFTIDEDRLYINLNLINQLYNYKVNPFYSETDRTNLNYIRRFYKERDKFNV